MTNGLDQPAAPDGPQERSALRASSIRQEEGVDAFQALQRVLYRSAKQDPQRRFHALYDKLTRRDVMWRAWVDVATNHGAPGVDGVTIASVKEGGVEAIRAFLDELAAEVEAGTYRPKPLRRVNIPKPGQPGKTRPLSIPCLRDRVLMAAAKSILEPVFEADFLPCSFGFRPKRSAHQALELVRTTANTGMVWVLDADISDCFGSLAFDAIVSQVERRVSDRKMLKLVRAWLKVGVLQTGWSLTRSAAPRRVRYVQLNIRIVLWSAKPGVSNVTLLPKIHVVDTVLWSVTDVAAISQLSQPSVWLTTCTESASSSATSCFSRRLFSNKGL